MFNLVFINDTCHGWVHHTTNTIIKRVTDQDPSMIIAPITSVQDLTGATMFGEPVLHVLRVDDKDALTPLIGCLKNYQDTGDTEMFSVGLIISSTLPKNRVTRLTNLIKTLGGEYYTSGKKTPRAHALDLFNGTRVPPGVRDFIIDWVGEDTESIYSTHSSISSLKSEEQAQLTVEAVAAHLPLQPGVKPPWGIPDALMAGDVAGAYRAYHETGCNTGFVMAYLRSYFMSVYTGVMALTINPQLNTTVVGEVMGVRGWAAQKRLRHARALTPQQGQCIMESIMRAGRALTGASRADETTIIIQCFTSISRVARTQQN